MRCLFGGRGFSDRALLEQRCFATTIRHLGGHSRKASRAVRTPHPPPHCVRRHPLPQGERGRRSTSLRHDRLPHSPPHAHAFPQLSRGEPSDARRRGGAGGTERRRKNQLHRGDFVFVARPRAAPRDAGGCCRQSGRRLLGGVRRSRRRARAGNARHRHRRAGNDASSSSRRCRIDREPVASATAFGDHLRMVWLTPAMDGLFLGAASERRRFFDRLVLAIDSEHSAGSPRLTAACARATACSRCAITTTTGVTRSTRNRGTRGCGRGDARPDRSQTSCDAAGTRAGFRISSAEIALDGWMENALMSEPATAWRTVTGRSCVPAGPRCHRRPHARRAASDRSYR